MADNSDTPETPAAEAPKPAPRRRGPRKATAGADAPAPKGATTRRTPAKRAPKDEGIVAKVEDGAATAAKSVRAAATRTATKASDTVTGTARKAATAVGAVKPRSSKRATPRSTAKGKKAAPKSTLARATDKVGGTWGAAAIAGGLAVAGATAAALLSLRSSSAKGDANTPPNANAGAHQPDGTDSSKSFEAGIADENTVPNA